MGLEIGTLVEVTMAGAAESEKMAVVRIDQARGIVILEDQKTKVKQQMSFEYFMESTGMKLDTRTLLKG